MRPHTTIGEEAVFIMLLACHGTVWETKNAGKFTLIRTDGSEKVVDGFGLGNGTQLTQGKEYEDGEGSEIRNGQEILKTGKLPRPPQGNHRSRRLGG